MKKRIIEAALAGAALSLAGASFAGPPVPGPTATLTVTGTITPPSCTLSLGANGNAAFGTTPLSSISNNATGTVLTNPQTVPLTITCTGNTQVAFGVKDNRAASVVSGLTANWASGIAAGTTSATNAFGLGQASSKNIGAYTLTANTFAVGGTAKTPATITLSNETLAPAASTSAGLAVNPSDATNLITWADSSSSTAASIGQTFTANIVVTPTVNQSSALPTSGNITFDGNATFTVYYL
ncbi:hypothetical protein WT97_19925 [Burkholderia sp. MSMB1459WGS]|uniref:DUF1120 domain-containing protein n=1 Tax=Burkholderia sp. MSMB1459WGS TaxID=1637970 RepID=UPI00075FF989|nr:DUF1120 domain-containing protein [Burkholderia sp. MSMB1459WGS]KWO40760.1 hypothetical protein WT97_19925 [Burkholderia sp. MSMB1459WGS]